LVKERADLRGANTGGAVISAVVNVVNVKALAVVVVIIPYSIFVRDSFFFLSYAGGLPL
jgi:hypothetical protein